MAQEKIITLEQEKVLSLFSKEDYLLRRFYFTGGTPLAAFYLFHRISEDLDFLAKEKYICQVFKDLLVRFKRNLNYLK